MSKINVGVTLVALIFINAIWLGSGDLSVQPFYTIEPSKCTSLPNNTIYPIGLNRARDLAMQLFKSQDIHVPYSTIACIRNNTDYKDLSQVINSCIDQLTINFSSDKVMVSRGLALNSANQWVSACAPHMPCLKFNDYIVDGTVHKLAQQCDVENYVRTLSTNYNFIHNTYMGITKCQKYLPEICAYNESLGDSSHIELKATQYACPVSKYLYTANFMLLYMLDPKVASNMPNCRQAYNG